MEVPKIDMFARNNLDNGISDQFKLLNNTSRKLNPKLSNQKKEIKKIDEIGFVLFVCAINIIQK